MSICCTGRDGETASVPRTALSLPKARIAATRLLSATVVLGDPESCLAHVCLGNALVYQAQYYDALIHLDQARLLSHDSKHCLGFWAYACALAGLRERAEEVLSKLTSLPRHEYVPSYFVGLIHLGLGQVDLAIDWFTRACDERTHWVIFLNSDPAFDCMSKHSRFKDMVERIELRTKGKV